MGEVEGRNLWKTYSQGRAYEVKGINFLCKDSEFIALLGPSGCGKSTTLRMIAGLEGITKGELLFDGKVVNGLTPRERNVALAFESYALYPPLTVFENIAFPLRSARAAKQEIRRRVNEMAEWLELKDILNRKPGRLSGGQQQRVSLARALIRKPSVLLLDEPLSHMDQSVRASIRIRIRRIHDEMEATTIYVTHDQEEAVALADRIIVMNQGEILQMGTAAELTNCPANEFVAGFIGEPAMNFIEAKGATDDQVMLLHEESPVVWRIGKRALGRFVKKDLLIGFRPDKVRLFDKAVDNGIHARVDVVEFQGERQILTIGIAEKMIKAFCSADRDIRPDHSVWISCEPNDIHVFDKESGLAILNGSRA
jgi:multiple sugar transport system ATP-binding protein